MILSIVQIGFIWMIPNPNRYLIVQIEII